MLFFFVVSAVPTESVENRVGTLKGAFHLMISSRVPDKAYMEFWDNYFHGIVIPPSAEV